MTNCVETSHGSFRTSKHQRIGYTPKWYVRKWAESSNSKSISRLSAAKLLLSTATSWIFQCTTGRSFLFIFSLSPLSLSLSLSHKHGWLCSSCTLVMRWNIQLLAYSAWQPGYKYTFLVPCKWETKSFAFDWSPFCCVCRRRHLQHIHFGHGLWVVCPDYALCWEGKIDEIFVGSAVITRTYTRCKCRQLSEVNISNRAVTIRATSNVVVCRYREKLLQYDIDLSFMFPITQDNCRNWQLLEFAVGDNDSKF